MFIIFHIAHRPCKQEKRNVAQFERITLSFKAATQLAQL